MKTEPDYKKQLKDYKRDERIGVEETYNKLVKENNEKIYLDIEQKLNDITKIVSVGYEKISVDVDNKKLEIDKLLQKLNPPTKGVRDIGNLYSKNDIDELPKKRPE